MIYFILSLVLTHTLAQESSQIYLAPCFSSQTQASLAMQKLSFIKTISDKIEINSQCLNILTNERREELYQNYLRQNFSNVRYQYTKAPKMCRLELIKTSVDKDQSTKLMLTKKIDWNMAIDNSMSTSTQSIVVSSGKSASLSVNNTIGVYLDNNLQFITLENSFSLKCKVTAKGYQLDITSNDQDNSFSSSVFIKKGETLSLGSLNKDNDNKGKTIRLNGITYNTVDIREVSSYKIRAK